MMIRINVVRDSQGFIWRFTVKGHAGFAKEGSDIVCSAVSVTAYTAVGAIGKLAGIRDCYIEKDGYMDCSIPQDIAAEQKAIIKIILETTVIGFKQIAYSYNKYVLVLEEVQSDD